MLSSDLSNNNSTPFFVGNYTYQLVIIITINIFFVKYSHCKFTALQAAALGVGYSLFLEGKRGILVIDNKNKTTEEAFNSEQYNIEVWHKIDQDIFNLNTVCFKAKRMSVSGSNTVSSTY